MDEKNNMDYDSICSLHYSKVEFRNASVTKDENKPAPVPAARKAGETDNNEDVNKRYNIEFWYCVKMGHGECECRLRRRNSSAQGRGRDRSRARGRGRGRGPGHHRQEYQMERKFNVYNNKQHGHWNERFHNAHQQACSSNNGV